jgi:hypothetical protein
VRAAQGDGRERLSNFAPERRRQSNGPASAAIVATVAEALDVGWTGGTKQRSTGHGLILQLDGNLGSAGIALREDK